VATRLLEEPMLSATLRLILKAFQLGRSIIY